MARDHALKSCRLSQCRDIERRLCPGIDNIIHSKKQDGASDCLSTRLISRFSRSRGGMKHAS